MLKPDDIMRESVQVATHSPPPSLVQNSLVELVQSVTPPPLPLMLKPDDFVRESVQMSLKIVQMRP